MFEKEKIWLISKSGKVIVISAISSNLIVHNIAIHQCVLSLLVCGMRQWLCLDPIHRVGPPGIFQKCFDAMVLGC